MRTVQSALPSMALRPFVSAFAQRTVSGVLEAQPMPAFLETVIHFEFGDVLTMQSAKGGLERARPLAVVGPHTLSGTGLRFEGRIDSFAIFLQPAALWSLFRIPTSAVADSHYDAEDVLGAPVAQLWNVLAETPDLAGRIRAAEAFLIRSMTIQPEGTGITAAASFLARRGGKVSIWDLASQMHISVRELERSFQREMGTTAKRFARVARFQSALDTKVGNPDRSWLDIAIDSGYHDQMHMVHEFHSLCGLLPTFTLEQLGDSRPSALVASHCWNLR